MERWLQMGLSFQDSESHGTALLQTVWPYAPRWGTGSFEVQLQEWRVLKVSGKGVLFRDTNPTRSKYRMNLPLRHMNHYSTYQLEMTGWRSIG